MESNFWKFILHFYSHELTILQFPFLVFFNLKNSLRSSYLIVINHFTNNILHFSIINNIINHHICKFHLWYYNSLSWNINYFYLDFNSNLKNETTITHLKKKKKKEEKRSENGRGLISFDASHSEILKQKSGRLKPPERTSPYLRRTGSFEQTWPALCPGLKVELWVTRAWI